MTRYEAETRLQAARRLRVAKSRTSSVRRDRVVGYTVRVSRLGLPKLTTRAGLELLSDKRVVVFELYGDGISVLAWRVSGRWIAGCTLCADRCGLFQGVLLPPGSDKTEAELAAREERRQWFA